MKTCVFVFLLLVSITASAQTERTTPATDAELAQITERGRNLAEYDVAARKLWNFYSARDSNKDLR